MKTRSLLFISLKLGLSIGYSLIKSISLIDRLSLKKCNFASFYVTPKSAFVLVITGGYSLIKSDNYCNCLCLFTNFMFIKRFTIILSFIE